MNILVIGFQRSGTTLLRRLLQLHPQIRKIYHEIFLLKKYNDKQSLLQFVSQSGINIKTENWGEKVPFFPTTKKNIILKYCEQWNEYFGKNSRILHIIRHPYDVALSNVKKFKYVKNIDKPIKLYKSVMPEFVETIGNMESTYTFKYEDLLLHSDEMMFNIYKHCGLNPNIDFRKKMQQIANQKYQQIDPNRAFAYKNQTVKWKYDIADVLEEMNKIDGVNYEL